MYCGGEDEQKNKITNLVYGGQCAGNKDFKTFYFTQTTVPDEQKRQLQSENGYFESQTQSIEVKTPGKRDSLKYKQKNVKLTLEDDADLPSPGRQRGK